MARMILALAVGGALLASGLRRSLATRWFHAMMVAVCGLNVAAVVASAFHPAAGLMELANSAAALVAGAVSFDLNCRSAWLL